MTDARLLTLLKTRAESNPVPESANSEYMTIFLSSLCNHDLPLNKRGLRISSACKSIRSKTIHLTVYKTADRVISLIAMGGHAAAINSLNKGAGALLNGLRQAS